MRTLVPFDRFQENKNSLCDPEHAAFGLLNDVTINPYTKFEFWNIYYLAPASGQPFER